MVVQRQRVLVALAVAEVQLAPSYLLAVMAVVLRLQRLLGALEALLVVVLVVQQEAAAVVVAAVAARVDQVVLAPLEKYASGLGSTTTRGSLLVEASNGYGLWGLQ